MRILLIGLLFLSFWAGVAGQNLPFETEVEDLNLSSYTRYSIRGTDTGTIF